MCSDLGSVCLTRVSPTSVSIVCPVLHLVNLNVARKHLLPTCCRKQSPCIMGLQYELLGTDVYLNKFMNAKRG